MFRVWAKLLAVCLWFAAIGTWWLSGEGGPSVAGAGGSVAASNVSAAVKVSDKAKQAGAAADDRRRVILLVADRLREADVANVALPHFRDWTKRGGIGLMNVNAGGEGLRKLLPPDGHTAGGGSMTVIEWDQLQAVEAEKGQLPNDEYIQRRQAALVELDRLAGELLRRAGRSTLLIVASSGVGADNQGGRWNRQLVPLLMAGGGITPGSLLTSPSTRRLGIVTNLDVAATIQDFLGVERPSGWTGQTVNGIQTGEDVWNTLHAIAQQAHRTYAKRVPVLTLFGAGGGICFLVMVAVLWKHGRGRWRQEHDKRMWHQEHGRRIAAMPMWRGIRRSLNRQKFAAVLMWGGTAVLAAPVAFLLLPLLETAMRPQGGPAEWRWPVGSTADWTWSVVMPALLLAMTWGLMRIRNLLQRLFVLACSIVGLVVADAAAGGRLAQGAILSYDPVVGARYYGVGNEYMACMVAWLLLACGYLLCMRPGWRTRMAWAFPVLGAGMIWFLASPELGANAGGTITAAAATAVAVSLLWGFPKRIGWPVGLALLAGSIVLLIGLHENAVRPTHVSLAADLVRQGDYQQIGALIGRKLLMNLYLIRDYAGAPLLVALMILAAIAVFRSAPWVSRFFEKRAGLQPFVNGGVAGALVGFAVNDSGVVVAALILLPVAYTVCMLSLVEAFPTPHTIVPISLSQPDTPDWWPGRDSGR
ncbi:alkaline phosphatase family protein [Effusibacillus pohliae]|uniref:hypothetical protein n=1 Tax=Effusibacillus pohliae TaxID=232270 RepID=UPI000373289F|nr:hypothetical protein [Effusibacillus pohliae]